MTDETTNLVLEQLRAIRREIVDLRTITLRNVDYLQRLERRMSETRDDLELMIKAELMGRLSHFETTMEQRIDALEGRLSGKGGSPAA